MDHSTSELARRAAQSSRREGIAFAILVVLGLLSGAMMIVSIVPFAVTLDTLA
jgi:hypothetical protein